jgi:hypothetical protein
VPCFWGTANAVGAGIFMVSGTPIRQGKSSSEKEGQGIPVDEIEFSTMSLSKSEDLALLNEGTTPAQGSITSFLFTGFVRLFTGVKSLTSDLYSKKKPFKGLFSLAI